MTLGMVMPFKYNTEAQLVKKINKLDPVKVKSFYFMKDDFKRTRR